MTADVVRETLKNEAELLGRMIESVKSVDSSGYTRQAQIIQNSWARFLGERKYSNEHLSKTDDKDLLSDLKNELSQVERYIEVTRTNPDFTEDWEAFVKCERDILVPLISKINDGKSSTRK